MQLAIILSAVEENLDEEKTERTPTAYFVSFLGLLDQAVSGEQVGNRELATSSLYFLDLVAPYNPHNLLQAKFTSILIKISPVLTDSNADAPILKSSIGVLETLLKVQDVNAWSISASDASAKRGLIGLMAFALDPRPKVRKRAHDAIFSILSNPPESLESHPGGPICAENSLKSITTLYADFQKNTTNSTTQLIHALQLCKAIISSHCWPLSLIEPICQTLLDISKSSEKFLISTAFDVFESLFKSLSAENDASKLLTILESIFDLRPNVEDQALASSWFLVVSTAVQTYSAQCPLESFSLIPKVFTLIIEFFSSNNRDIQSSAAQCLIAICENGIPQSVLASKKTNTCNEVHLILSTISETIFQLLNVKYQDSWKDIMLVVASLSNSLMWLSDPYLINCFKVIGTLRSTEAISDGWQEAEKVIGAAIRNIGPEKTLEMFPLNLQGTSQPTRTWLLPLLRENVGFSDIQFFKDYFVGLSGELEAMIGASRNQAGKLTNEAATKIKIYETLIDQIWSLFPSFCDLPLDLREGFDQEFPKLLMNVVYNYTELRGHVFTGLKLLVESNQQYLSGSLDDNLQLLQRFPKEEASKNLEYLATFSLNILASLFNIFTVTPIDSRAQLLECSKAYLSIISASDLEVTFNRVSSALSDALKTPQAGADKENDIPPTSATMLDLIMQMVSFLPKDSFNALITIFVTVSKNYNDHLLQKRVYRLFSLIADSDYGKEIIQSHLDNLAHLFLETSDQVQTTARGPRLNALSSFITLLPQESLSFVPAIVSEVIIATKDLNEKTREASFSLLVKMGHVMSNGGTIDRTQIPGMPSDAASVPASLEEYVTIVAAGLADTTTHTQAATILALSRIVFEFKSSLTIPLLQELTGTVEMFLENRNREVADATLGFVKVAVVSLPRSVVEPNLKNLIGHLLNWYREHSSHFRTKIKHLIERLLRVFGFEIIAQNFPEEDLKFLNNIRKSKERAKRKKVQALSEKDVDEMDSHRNRKHFAKTAKFESEFDRALYGSSSEGEDSDDDKEGSSIKESKKKKSHDRFIVEDGDPLDLLDQRTLAHITSTKPSAKKRLAIPEKKKFKKDADGRLIIKAPDASEDDPLASIGNSLTAYEEAIKNGPVKDSRGIYRYKRGRHNMDDGDDMSDDEKPKPKLAAKKITGKTNRGFKGSASKKNTPGHRRFYN